MMLYDYPNLWAGVMQFIIIKELITWSLNWGYVKVCMCVSILEWSLDWNQLVHLQQEVQRD